MQDNIGLSSGYQRQPMYGDIGFNQQPQMNSAVGGVGLSNYQAQPMYGQVNSVSMPTQSTLPQEISSAGNMVGGVASALGGGTPYGLIAQGVTQAAQTGVDLYNRSQEDPDMYLQEQKFANEYMRPEQGNINEANPYGGWSDRLKGASLGAVGFGIGNLIETKKKREYEKAQKAAKQRYQQRLQNYDDMQRDLQQKRAQRRAMAERRTYIDPMANIYNLG